MPTAPADPAGKYKSCDSPANDAHAGLASSSACATRTFVSGITAEKAFRLQGACARGRPGRPRGAGHWAGAQAHLHGGGVRAGLQRQPGEDVARQDAHCLSRRLQRAAGGAVAAGAPGEHRQQLVDGTQHQRLAHQPPARAAPLPQRAL